MLHTPPLPPPSPIHPLDNPVDLLFSVLENSETGVMVIDSTDRAVYMNASARSLLESPLGMVPAWLGEFLPRLRAGLERSGQVVDRISHEGLTLRVRVRSLPRPGIVLVELHVAHGTSAGREVAEQLSRSLGLTITDARLLAMLWQGLSNEEIAGQLSVRTGTIKSRLFRLYQRLGVKKRPAAVLRAAEVLAS
jgi:DNA-binding CsgD family transcriptional regulator